MTLMHPKRIFLSGCIVMALSGCGANESRSDAAEVVSFQNTSPARQIPHAVTDAQPSAGAKPQLTSMKVDTSGNDWPQFRGPGGQGISHEGGLPTEWTSQSNIRWKTQLPGAGTSSPIFFGDLIYLTCYRGFGVPGEPSGNMSDLALTLVCLNRSDGSIRWQKEITPSLPEQQTIRDEHGYASSTPVADDNHVYIFLGKTGVFAFDHNGNQQWHKTVGSKLSGWGSAASPILHGDNLIVNASVESESLYALNRQTGEQVWQANGIKEAWNTPVLMPQADGSTELIVPIFPQPAGH